MTDTHLQLLLQRGCLRGQLTGGGLSGDQLLPDLPALLAVRLLLLLHAAQLTGHLLFEFTNKTASVWHLLMGHAHSLNYQQAASFSRAPSD